MRGRLLAALCALSTAWPFPAQAEDHEARRCALSFEAGTYDLCRQRSGFDAGVLADVVGHTEGTRWSYWLLKFETSPGSAERAALAAIGAEVLDYLPHDAYRIRLPRGQVPAAGLPGVVWHGAVAPAWKPTAGALALLTAAESERPPVLPLSVALNAGADVPDLLQRFLAVEGVHHGFPVVGARSERIVLSVESRHIDSILLAIAPLAEVASIAPRKRMEFLNARAGWLHQSGTPGQHPIFDRGIHGCGQVVAVLDSGVDFSHCSFHDSEAGAPPVSDCGDGAACAPGVPDFLQRKTAHYYKWSGAGDGLGDAACADSGGGHGTHVAGSITGSDPGNAVDCVAGTYSGVPGNLDGTAPGAHLIAQEMGEGLEYVNSLGGNVYHAATVAYANGARIHSNSWGGSCCFLGVLCLAPFACTPSYDSLARDADEAIWDFPDLLIAIAAGNNGTCCASVGGAVGSPGLAKSALTVGASGAGASGGNAAAFSSRGPIFDNRTKPDVMAQGEGIVSSASNGDPGTSSCGTCTFSGTSMATPTAAGLAALVREYLVRGFYPSGAESAADAIDAPSAALLKAMLINGARDMGGTGAGAAAPNQVEGWGRIHLDDVLHFVGEERRLWLVDATEGVQVAEQDSYAIEVLDEPGALKATLVWSDFPAAVNANPHIVNVLRLEVEDPSGSVWTQKLPGSGAPNPFQSIGTTGYDQRNVVHQLQFPSPQAGTWQLRVRGIAVPMGKPGQPYALVVTGPLDISQGGGSEVDLALTKSAAQTEVPAGGVVEWFIEIENLGPDPASGIVVTDLLPAAVTPIAAAGDQWTCQIDGLEVGCELDGTLAPAASAPTISVTATAPAGPTVIENQASVAASETDTDPGNNSGSAEVTVLAAPEGAIFADGFEAIDPDP